MSVLVGPVTDDKLAKRILLGTTGLLLASLTAQAVSHDAIIPRWIQGSVLLSWGLLGTVTAYVQWNQNRSTRNELGRWVGQVVHLTIAVVSLSGAVLGGLFFAHLAFCRIVCGLLIFNIVASLIKNGINNDDD